MILPAVQIITAWSLSASDLAHTIATAGEPPITPITPIDDAPVVLKTAMPIYDRLRTALDRVERSLQGYIRFEFLRYW